MNYEVGICNIKVVLMMYILGNCCSNARYTNLPGAVTLFYNIKGDNQSSLYTQQTGQKYHKQVIPRRVTIHQSRSSDYAQRSPYHFYNSAQKSEYQTIQPKHAAASSEQPIPTIIPQVESNSISQSKQNTDYDKITQKIQPTTSQLSSSKPRVPTSQVTAFQATTPQVRTPQVTASQATTPQPETTFESATTSELQTTSVSRTSGFKETKEQEEERLLYENYTLVTTGNRQVINITLLRVHWHILSIMFQSNDELMPKFVQLGYHSCLGGCDGCIDLSVDDNKGLSEAYKTLLAYHRNVSDVISFADLVILAATNAANIGMYKGGGTRLIPYQVGRKTCDDPENPNKVVVFPKGSDPHALDRLMEEFDLAREDAIALIGAHSLGRCHKENLGFQGPWDNTPLILNNAYYVALLGFMKAVKTPARSSHQWILERADVPSDFTRMMLNAEMIIVSNFTVSGHEDTPSCSLSRCPGGDDCQDKLCPVSLDKDVARKYKNNQDEFHKDFIRAFIKMTNKTQSTLTDPTYTADRCYYRMSCYVV